MQTIDLSSILQKKFIGTDELRKKLPVILDELPKQGGEIVVTQHGKPQAVLLDLESYLELQDTLADYDPEFVAELNETLADAKAGNVVPADEVFKQLGI